MRDFNFDKFISENIAVHCDTEEKSLDFIKKCRENNIKWCSDDELSIENTNWGGYKEETCYKYQNNRTHGLEYCSRSFYKNENYKIIEWETEESMNEEFSKSDLKSGMVIETRNKHRWLIINSEAINKNGWTDLNSYDNTLKSKIELIGDEMNRYYDIVKVFDVQKGYKSKLDNLDNVENLIWERKEIKEMTIEEIQKELGYKIKIVETNSNISQLKQSSGKCRGGF